MCILLSVVILLLQAGELQILKKHDGLPGTVNLNITTIELYGLDRLPSNVRVDGLAIDAADVRSMNQVCTK